MAGSTLLDELLDPLDKVADLVAHTFVFTKKYADHLEQF
jgi:hypothetical protein